MGALYRRLDETDRDRAVAKLMKGPILSLPTAILSSADAGELDSPESMIATLARELMDGIPDDLWELMQDRDQIAPLKLIAEEAALYLARFWHQKNPWWSDKAIGFILESRLPITRSVQVAQCKAMEIRAQAGRKSLGLNQFIKEQLDDLAFYRLGSMRSMGFSAADSAREAARLLDYFSDGTLTRKASHIEKEFRRWKMNPLRGAFWARGIEKLAQGMPPEEREAAYVSPYTARCYGMFCGHGNAP